MKDLGALDSANRSMGLYYVHGRWYNQDTGLFLSPDEKGEYFYGSGQNAVNYAWMSDTRKGGPTQPATIVPPLRYVNCDVNALNCSVEQFEQMGIDQRIRWMHDFQMIHQTLGWFNNIESILQFLKEKNLVQPSYPGYPGSYVSWVDAAILQAIQDGRSRQFFNVSSPGNSPAGPYWQTFFFDFNKRPRASDVDLKVEWGTAERHATNYGRDLAQQKNADYGAWGNAVATYIAIDVFGDIYRNVTGVPYGGGGVGAGGGVYLGIVTCGPAHVVCSPLYGAQGYQAGEFFTDPRSQFLGRGPTYYAAEAIYRTVYNFYYLGYVLDLLYNLQPK